MNIDTPVLDMESLNRFMDLEAEAAKAAGDAFHSSSAGAYPGESGRLACRGDFALILEFLRSVLQSGILKPLVEGLHWWGGMLKARGVEPLQVTASIERMGAFFAARLPQPDAAIVAAALRKAALRAEQLETPQAPAWADVAGAWPASLRFEEAILAGDRAGARRILFESLAHSNLLTAEQRLIQPALYRIGLRWQRNQVSVAQEHLASITVQSLMTEALLEAPLAPWNGRRALLACVEGNHHAIGLQMVADGLQLAGWSVQCLGANVPTQAILAQDALQQPDLLGLSLCFPQHLVHVRALMNGLNRVPRPRVIVGGLAVRQLEQLAAACGVDGVCTDATCAVDLAGRLVARPEAA